MRSVFSRHMLAVCAAGGLTVGLAGSSVAAISFDQDVTNEVIFGSGNANGAFTVDRNRGVELGLRGKLRFDSNNQPQNIFNSNGDGTYTFQAGTPPTGFGFDPNSPTTPVWNFEWSINTDYDGSTSTNLADYTYELGIDFDPSAGVNWLLFDPINQTYADHAIGTNATGNGGGSVAADDTEYATLIANNNLAQNSWSMEFFNDPPFDTFDPNQNGEYSFYILARDINGRDVARVDASILVVPEPGSLASLGLGGLALLRRRR